MAKPPSRTARLAAGIALGTGAAIVINHHPALFALWSVVFFVYLCFQTISWMATGLDKVEERPWRRDRIGRRAAAKTGTTTTTVRCWVCQHVSAVPQSQQTLVCEHCGARLSRGMGPANSG